MTIPAVDHSTPSAVLEREPAKTTPAGQGFDTALKAARGTTVGPATHEVRAGETLSEIVLAHLRGRGENPSNAALYDAVHRVAAANGLANPDRIFPGQTLTLDSPGASEPSGPDPAREQVVKALVPPPAPRHAPVPLDVGGPKHTPQNFSHARFESLRQVADDITEVFTRPIRYAKGAESLMRLLPLSSARTEVATVAALKQAAPAPPTAEPAKAYSPWSKIVSEPARLTSEFGPRRDPFDGGRSHHDGIDLATKRGSNIYPMAEGVVKFSGWMPGYGNVVVVKHEDGLETVYGHNAKNLVKAGQKVSGDDAIATVGSSGRSTGPHVHFEIRQRGKAVDPVPHLTAAQS